MESKANRYMYQRAVLAYHYLPGVIVVVLLGGFLAAFFATGSYLLSSFAAAAPALLLLWRWIVAARRVDHGCPNCGNPFPKKMYWTFPPDVCPRCGQPVHQPPSERPPNAS